ncbi:hypothetical protein [Nocardioides sp.]|uniref:hypothetical protein n=1 Tax=Nocardioides sp. TaxID=35761 RepID=UPI002C9FEE56|nr:hypothetical protein [Nocardioides sp.]HSX66604.1 hypothetical protein [Nocardioides sp.]
MTETTTLPVREASSLPIGIEDDATPLVRQIGQALREAARVDHLPQVLADVLGTVTVRSHDTPQAATILIDASRIDVTSGPSATPDATVVVDLHARFAATEAPEGNAALATAVLSALRPPLPHWRDAAERFWAATRSIPGIPDVLVVETEGPDGPETGRFGAGTTQYLMAGPADLLAGVFTGADDFLASLAAGVQIKGTLAQLSVMTAASWKVRFDV